LVIATRFLLYVRPAYKPTQKTALNGAVLLNRFVQFLALASFELALRLVDHVDAAFATHNTAITVPVLERAERVLDLHGLSPICGAFIKDVASAWVCGCPGNPEQ
jgi:hypothetical protein